MSDFQKEAEAHWKYTETLVVKIAKLYGETISDEMLDLIRYCYIEAMKHGWKHAFEFINVKELSQK